MTKTPTFQLHSRGWDLAWQDDMARRWFDCTPCMQIHTGKMQQNSFLGADVDLWKLAQRTKNFSGAEIEGLVKSATSFALNRQVDVNDLSKPIDEDNLKVSIEPACLLQNTRRSPTKWCSKAGQCKPASFIEQAYSPIYDLRRAFWGWSGAMGYCLLRTMQRLCTSHETYASQTPVSTLSSSMPCSYETTLDWAPPCCSLARRFPARKRSCPSRR